MSDLRFADICFENFPYNIIQVQRPGDDIESFQSGVRRSYAKPKVSSTLVSLELASTEALH